MKKNIAYLSTILLLTACTSTNKDPRPTNSAYNPTPTPAIIADDGLTKTIMLTEQNASGQTGTVEITATDDGKAIINLTMDGTPSSVPQPAHIHLGQCPTPGAVKYPLTNVVNGKSTTTLDVDLDTLWADATNLAINVHKSSQELNVYTSCGNLEL